MIDLSTIQKSQIPRHFGNRTTNIKYIVIHDTGNTSTGANALAHKKYFSTTARKASADFVVDCREILQLNNYIKYYTWHCGDGRGRFGITNNNSIGIEICVNKDGNYQKAVNNAIKLVYALQKELNIPDYCVVRHWDASRKVCPASMTQNNWQKWHNFKKALKDYAGEQTAPYLIELIFNGKTYFIDGEMREDHNWCKIRDIVEILGYKIDGKGNIVTISN